MIEEGCHDVVGIHNRWCHAYVVMPGWWFEEEQKSPNGSVVPAVAYSGTVQRGVLLWKDVPASFRYFGDWCSGKQQCNASTKSPGSEIERASLQLKLRRCTASATYNGFCRQHARSAARFGAIPWTIMFASLQRTFSLTTNANADSYWPVLDWREVPKSMLQKTAPLPSRKARYQCPVADFDTEHKNFARCGNILACRHPMCFRHLQVAFSIGIAHWDDFCKLMDSRGVFADATASAT